jgi:hypothetical protein
MTIDSANIIFDSTTDVNFRAWGQRISQALITCGLVKTTDTGQIDWTTVTRGAGNVGENISGYEIFRFSDALQATHPVFIKIEYGNANAANSGPLYGPPVIYVTVGTATNGAGTLTGSRVSTRTRLLGMQSTAGNSNNGVSSGTTQQSPCYFSGDGTYINMALGVQQTAHAVFTTGGSTPPISTPGFFGVERTRNSLGEPTNRGVHMVTSKWASVSNTHANAPSPTSQLISYVGAFTVSPQDGFWPVTWPGQGYGTAAQGADIYFHPMMIASPVPDGQCLSWLGSWKNDVPFLSPQVVTVSGQPHTYLSLAGIAGQTAADNARSYVNTGTPNGALLMRYE